MICAKARGFFAEKWKLPHRSAFFESKIGTDSSYAVLNLSEHARIRREKVRTAPTLGICLVENQRRFILRGRGCVWKYADFSQESGSAAHR